MADCRIGFKKGDPPAGIRMRVAFFEGKGLLHLLTTEPRLIVGTTDKPIDSRAKRTADNRRYPEKPELGKLSITHKQGHADTAGRIHGGVRPRNTD